MSSSKTTMYAIGIAVSIIVAGSVYYYTQGKNEESQPDPAQAKKVEEIKEETPAPLLQAESEEGNFVDPMFEKNQFLSKVAANIRSQNVSEVTYLVAMGLVKGGQSFHGKVQINFKLAKITEDYVVDGNNDSCLFIDYKGKMVDSIDVNGKMIKSSVPNVFQGHKIYIPQVNQKVGDNIVTIEFESAYVKDCEGLQHYLDPDGAEYVYTELEPNHCHMWFPCFDQPDLKAQHKMLVLVEEDWTVISNSAEIGAYKCADVQETIQALKRFQIHDAANSNIVKSFGSNKFVSHEFERSKAFSTYLYCVVAGPFDCLTPSPGCEHPTIPMKLYCRKSLTKYAEKIKDDWFRVTNIGIKYYEKVFQTPYAFGKFDQVLCPDYAMGAMENVGCVTYNDEYIPRDEEPTRQQMENKFNTILHEISHMWFGNLVTMKWWDDLWLNESFANTVSYMCMDEGEGADDITLAWNIFLDEQNWGLTTDQKISTHSIATTCATTADAEDMFDGISYGKGAAFLKQMIYFMGKDVLLLGLKTYFEKYSYKNTELSDFIAEMNAAVSKLQPKGKDFNFTQWTDTWLKTPGCNDFEIKYEVDKSNKITKFELHQGIYNHAATPENRLRVQDFNICTLDDKMKVQQSIRLTTSDTQAVTTVNEFVGQALPAAFILNHGANGYGKFVYDETTLQTFETKLHLIEDKLNRKQAYFIMLDMVKSGKIAGARVLSIIQKNIEFETAEDVLEENFKHLIPVTIAKYIPMDQYIPMNQGLFESTLKILASGRFKQSSTKELLLSSAIGFANGDQQMEMMYTWFMGDKITDLKGKPIEGVTASTKAKHEMVKKIFAAVKIPQDKKKEAFAKLGQIDSSDMLVRTKQHCEACVPDYEAKREVWLDLMEMRIEPGVQGLLALGRGFRQFSQLEILDKFSDEFFEKIENVVDRTGQMQAERTYIFLQPNMRAEENDIKRYTDFLAKIESQPKKESTERLIKWVKESIQDLNEKKAARDLSRQWSKNAKL